MAAVEDTDDTNAVKTISRLEIIQDIQDLCAIRMELKEAIEKREAADERVNDLQNDLLHIVQVAKEREDRITELMLLLESMREQHQHDRIQFQSEIFQLTNISHEKDRSILNLEKELHAARRGENIHDPKHQIHVKELQLQIRNLQKDNQDYEQIIDQQRVERLCLIEHLQNARSEAISLQREKEGPADLRQAVAHADTVDFRHLSTGGAQVQSPMRSESRPNKQPEEILTEGDLPLALSILTSSPPEILSGTNADESIYMSRQSHAAVANLHDKSSIDLRNSLLEEQLRQTRLDSSTAIETLTKSLKSDHQKLADAQNTIRKLQAENEKIQKTLTERDERHNILYGQFRESESTWSKQYREIEKELACCKQELQRARAEPGNMEVNQHSVGLEQKASCDVEISHNVKERTHSSIEQNPDPAARLGNVEQTAGETAHSSEQKHENILISDSHIHLDPTELEAAQDRIFWLDRELERERAESVQLRSTLASLKEVELQKTIFEDDLRRLKQELKSVCNDRTAFSQLVTTLQREISVSRQKAQSEIDQRLSVTKELHDKIAALEASLLIEKEDAHALRSVVSSLRNVELQNKSLEIKVKGLQSDLDSALLELAQLKQRCSVLEDENFRCNVKLRNDSKELEDTKKRMVRLENDLRQLSESYEQEKQQCSHLRSACSKLKDMEIQNVLLTEQNANLKRDVTNFSQEIIELKEAIDSLQSDLLAAKAQSTDLETEKWRITVRELEELRGKVTALQSELARGLDERFSLEAKISALKDSELHNKRLKEEIRNLSADLQILKKEKIQLQEKVAASEETHRSVVQAEYERKRVLENQVKALNISKAQLEKDYESIQSICSELRDQLSKHLNSTRQLDDAIAQIVKLEAELMRVNKENAFLQSKFEGSMQLERTDWTKVTQTERRIQTLEDEIASLLRDLRNASLEKIDLQNLNKLLAEEVLLARRQASDFLGERCKIIDGASQTISTLQAELNETNRLSSHEAEELMILNGKVKLLEDELRRVESMEETQNEQHLEIVEVTVDTVSVGNNASSEKVQSLITSYQNDRDYKTAADKKGSVVDAFQKKAPAENLDLQRKTSVDRLDQEEKHASHNLSKIFDLEFSRWMHQIEECTGRLEELSSANEASILCINCRLKALEFKSTDLGEEIQISRTQQQKKILEGSELRQQYMTVESKHQVLDKQDHCSSKAETDKKHNELEMASSELLDEMHNNPERMNSTEKITEFNTELIASEECAECTAIASLLETMQSDKLRLENEVSALQVEMQTASREKSKLLIAISALEHEIHPARDEGYLESLDTVKELVVAKQEIAQIQAQMQALRRALTLEGEEKNMAKQEVLSLRQKLEHCVSDSSLTATSNKLELDRLKAIIQALENALASEKAVSATNQANSFPSKPLDDPLAPLKNELTSCKQNLQTQLEENCDLKERLGNVEDALALAQKQIINNDRNQGTELEKLKAVNQRVVELESDLHSKAAIAATDYAEKTRLQQQIAQLQEEFQRFLHDSSVVEDEKNRSLQQLMQQLVQNEKDLLAAHSQCSAWQLRCKRLEQVQDMNQCLQREVHDLKAAVQTATSDKSQLLRSIALLEEEIHESRNQSLEIERLNHTLVQAASGSCTVHTIDSLLSSGPTSQKPSDDIEKQIQFLHGKAASGEEINSSLREQIGALKAELSMAQREISTCSNELVSRQTALETANHMATVLQAELHTKTLSLCCDAEAKIHLQQQITQLQEEFQRFLHDSADVEVEKNRSLQEMILQLAQIETELLAARSQCSVLQLRCNRLEQVQDMNKSLEAKIHKLKADLKTATSEKALLLEGINSLEREIHISRNQTTSVWHEKFNDLSAAHDKISQLQAHVQKIRREFVNAQESNTVLKQKISYQEEELQKAIRNTMLAEAASMTEQETLRQQIQRLESKTKIKRTQFDALEAQVAPLSESVISILNITVHLEDNIKGILGILTKDPRISELRNTIGISDSIPLKLIPTEAQTCALCKNLQLATAGIRDLQGGISFIQDEFAACFAEMRSKAEECSSKLQKSASVITRLDEALQLTKFEHSRLQAKLEESLLIARAECGSLQVTCRNLDEVTLENHKLQGQLLSLQQQLRHNCSEMQIMRQFMLLAAKECHAVIQDMDSLHQNPTGAPESLQSTVRLTSIGKNFASGIASKNQLLNLSDGATLVPAERPYSLQPGESHSKDQKHALPQKAKNLEKPISAGADASNAPKLLAYCDPCQGLETVGSNQRMQDAESVEDEIERLNERLREPCTASIEMDPESPSQEPGPMRQGIAEKQQALVHPSQHSTKMPQRDALGSQHHDALGWQPLPNALDNTDPVHNAHLEVEPAGEQKENLKPQPRQEISALMSEEISALIAQVAELDRDVHSAFAKALDALDASLPDKQFPTPQNPIQSHAGQIEKPVGGHGAHKGLTSSCNSQSDSPGIKGDGHQKGVIYDCNDKSASPIIQCEVDQQQLRLCTSLVADVHWIHEQLAAMECAVGTLEQAAADERKEREAAQCRLEESVKAGGELQEQVRRQAREADGAALAVADLERLVVQLRMEGDAQRGECWELARARDDAEAELAGIRARVLEMSTSP